MLHRATISFSRISRKVRKNETAHSDGILIGSNVDAGCNFVFFSSVVTLEHLPTSLPYASGAGVLLSVRLTIRAGQICGQRKSREKEEQRNEHESSSCSVARVRCSGRCIQFAAHFHSD